MGSPEQHLAERLELEDLVLREAFPNASGDRAANAVILADHHLPPGWSHGTSDVAFGFPPNYRPAAPTTSVCVPT